MFLCIRIDVEKLLWLCFSATVVRDALGPYWLWPGWSGASCASWERQASWDGKHCVIIGKNMCASVACKLTKSKCECDMVARWVAEGKRIEWHKHEKMFARKRFCVPCCRAFCRRWATVDWGSVWCKTSGWWLAWLWIVCVSVAFAAALWFRMCRVIWEKMVACICCKCVEMDDRFCVEAWRHMWYDVVLAQKVAKWSLRVGDKQDGVWIGGCAAILCQCDQL